eukprot:CAMPEP_0194199288 /NCGR_PEP_ID=MMETSP0156-20130528/364_1 /TAXON_ID=33649 /ORGANISM="Thalassionema nitzschioides, Strain L26-B" /LENGTH=99 /DNA_ID=CAMNT_0038924163 /DNA_START=67 /DNA_END=367 /DNA_ORIENTATION=-
MTSAEVNPSMLRLLGTGDWDTLKELIETGAYNDMIHDNSKMLAIIIFAVNFEAPVEILHLMCNLNPDALMKKTLPSDWPGNKAAVRRLSLYLKQRDNLP